MTAKISKKSRHLTFPISFLIPFSGKTSQTISDIFSYCLYRRIQWESGPPKDFDYDPEPEDMDIFADEIGIQFGNIGKSYDAGKILYHQQPENCVRCSVSLDLLFKFYYSPKTDFEKACFLAYAAFKSIVQKAPFKKVTNAYLLSRMSGNATIDGPLTEIVKSHSSRWKLNKIKAELEKNWNVIKTYSYYNRGFYVATNPNVDMKDMIRFAELKKVIQKGDALNEHKKDLRNQVLKEIKSTNYESLKPKHSHKFPANSPHIH